MSNWIKVEVKSEKKYLYPDAPIGAFYVTYVSLLKSFVDRKAQHWYAVEDLLVVDENMLNGRH